MTFSSATTSLPNVVSRLWCVYSLCGWHFLGGYLSFFYYVCALPPFACWVPSGPDGRRRDFSGSRVQANHPLRGVRVPTVGSFSSLCFSSRRFHRTMSVNVRARYARAASTRSKRARRLVAVLPLFTTPVPRLCNN